MKILPRVGCLLAASIVACATPSLAQSVPTGQSRSLAPARGAAATLPNTFDRPTSAPPSVPVVTTAPPADVAIAEAALKVVIDQLRAGALDTTMYTPGLTTRLQGQMATMRPMLNGFGDLLTIEAQGTRDGAGQFLVTFEEAATQWLIGLDQQGRIAALLFRLAPPESSEPAGTPPA